MTPVQRRSMHVVLDVAHEQLQDMRKHEAGNHDIRDMLIELEDSISSLNRMLEEHQNERNATKCI